MVITVRAIVPACDTNQHGDAVRDAIERALTSGGTVEISFAGITSATTSFVNSAFVDLLGALSFDEIKRRIRVVHSTRQINDMIRTRLSHEAQRALVA